MSEFVYNIRLLGNGVGTLLDCIMWFMTYAVVQLFPKMVIVSSRSNVCCISLKLAQYSGIHIYTEYSAIH